MEIGLAPDRYPTLSELLKLPVFEGSVVLSGRTRLDAPVKDVNLTDTPDYDQWISAGELLITTCYAIKDDEEALREFIPRLKGAGMVGVCIKPLRFLGEMPEELVTSALDLDFPLVQLAPEVRFTDIIKAVTDELLRRYTSELRDSAALNKLMIDMVAEGAPLDEIVGCVADLTGDSVLVVDCINNRRSWCLSDLDATLCRDLDESEICKSLEQSGETFLLTAGKQTFGALYLCGGRKLEGPNGLLVEQIIQTIPLEISRERLARDRERRNFADFYLNLLSDGAKNAEREQLRASAFGLNLSEPHVVMRARLREPGARYSVRNPERNPESCPEIFRRTSFAYDMRSAANRLGLKAHTVEQDDDFIMLLSASDGGCLSAPGFFDALESETDALLARYSPSGIAVGCGRTYAGIAGIVRSDSESRVALDAASAKGGGLLRFDKLGILRLVYAEKTGDEVSAFVAETLGGLALPDCPNREELLATLGCYFRHFGNQRHTAEELYLHYNTVSYRLKSIQKITGLDLSDPLERLQLELALYLREACRTPSAR